MSEPWMYAPGDYYVLDDISGFKVRHSRVRKIPGGQTGGLLVDTKRWETQHPQDFVRGIVDDQRVPEARPRQKNRFVIVGSWITEFAPQMARAITLDSTEGFEVWHKVAVMLDNGEPYYPTITRIVGNQLYLTPVLPWSVGTNIGDPIENTVIDYGPSDLPPVIATDGGMIIVDDFGDMLAAGA